MATTRRNFLLRGWKFGGALLAAAAGWTVYESLRPLASASTGATIELGDPSRYPAESRDVRPPRAAVRRQHRHGHLRPLAEVPAPRLPGPVLRLVGLVRVPMPWFEVRPRR